MKRERGKIKKKNIIYMYYIYIKLTCATVSIPLEDKLFNSSISSAFWYF